MSISTSKIAYEDCYALLDRALEARHGIKIVVPNYQFGRGLCTRINYARVLDRQTNREVYPEGDPHHGVSSYDVLTIRYPKEEAGRWWIKLEKVTVDTLVVEEIEAE